MLDFFDSLRASGIPEVLFFRLEDKIDTKL